MMNWDEKLKIMEREGWTVECESPLEIRHEDGSFATLGAARTIIEVTTDDYWKKL